MVWCFDSGDCLCWGVLTDNKEKPVQGQTSFVLLPPPLEADVVATRPVEIGLFAQDKRPVVLTECLHR